jgi:hypothetical protein
MGCRIKVGIEIIYFAQMLCSKIYALGGIYIGGIVKKCLRQ